ncbi:TPA: hypothetical protein I7136_23550 [Vibrio vulnificus]|nr:hypothetical protein [Vibrio vulnificus]
MNLLVSEQCANELKSPKYQASLDEVVNILSSLDPATFKSRSDVKRVADTKEEIYVLRHKTLRMFFTFSEDKLVLMSTTTY